MASFLVTGASRGYGLALVRELASMPSSEVSKVLASARSESPALGELVQQSSGRVAVIKFDVTDQDSIQKAAVEAVTQLGGKGLDVLINNAGVAYWNPNGIRTMENLEDAFAVNVLGTHWVTREFLPLLQQGHLKKVMNISSAAASITLARDFTHLKNPAYKISKAALNALTAQFALEYEKEGFTIFAVSPGWMKTEMGGGDAADLTPEESAKAALNFIFNKGKELNGRFLKVHVKGWENRKGRAAYDGTDAPW